MGWPSGATSLNGVGNRDKGRTYLHYPVLCSQSKPGFFLNRPYMILYKVHTLPTKKTFFKKQKLKKKSGREAAVKVDQVSSICDMFGDTERPQSVQGSAAVVKRCLQWFHLQDNKAHPTTQPKETRLNVRASVLHTSAWFRELLTQNRHIWCSDISQYPACFRLPADQVLEHA